MCEFQDIARVLFLNIIGDSFLLDTEENACKIRNRKVIAVIKNFDTGSVFLV
jgi:hypothetical protein